MLTQQHRGDPTERTSYLEEDNHKAAGVDTLLVGKDSRNPCQPWYPSRSLITYRPQTQREYLRSTQQQPLSLLCSSLLFSTLLLYCSLSASSVLFLSDWSKTASTSTTSRVSEALPRTCSTGSSSSNRDLEQERRCPLEEWEGRQETDIHANGGGIRRWERSARHLATSGDGSDFRPGIDAFSAAFSCPIFELGFWCLFFCERRKDR